MLRNVGLRAAAAAAAAGAPSTSHCHAHAPRLKKLHKADSGEGVLLKEYTGGHEVLTGYHSSALLCQNSALTAFQLLVVC